MNIFKKSKNKYRKLDIKDKKFYKMNRNINWTKKILISLKWIKTLNSFLIQVKCSIYFSLFKHSKQINIIKINCTINKIELMGKNKIES